MLSFFRSLSAWDWLDILGLLMVLGGVAGEIAVRRKMSKLDDPKPLAKWEHFWEHVLVAGLALEMIALPHHFIESGRLEEIARRANERTALVESNNLVLQSNLWVLEHASPAKQRVFSASAFVKFHINSTNFIKGEVSMASANRPSAGMLFFTRRSEPRDNVGTINLMSEAFSQFQNEITMDMHWWPHFRRIIGSNENETCEGLISELNRGIFHAMLFKQAVDVTNASVALVLNGVVRKEFKLGISSDPTEGNPGVMFSVIESANPAINTR